MKTSKLTGTALDWAVAKCDGADWWAAEEPRDGMFVDYERTKRYSPSTNWNQGGPIIEREGVELQCWRNSRIDHWTAVLPDQVNEEGDPIWDGPTPLIAAMRCFVASRLGDDVDIPAELI